MSPPVLSGFDLATRLSGWCTGDGQALPHAGAWAFPQVGDDIGQLIDLFDRALYAHIETHKPEAAAYEAPILLTGLRGGRTDSLLPLRKIYGMGTHLEFVCRRRGIACSEVEIREVKKELAGFGGAQKADMVAAAEKLGVQLPGTQAAGKEDAADGLAVWLLLLRSSSPKLSARFDAKLWGSRGGLPF